MTPITADQLALFGYEAALRGEKSATCPTSYLGYVIPDVFPDGESAQAVWRVAYRDGIECRAAYEVEGRQDAERDWQD
jgi:hypothetical protein